MKRWNEGARNAQQVYRELKEMGYTGSDQPIQRYYVQFRKEKDFRKFKQVDPTLETPVKAPPRRPQRLRRWLIGSPLRKISVWSGKRSISPNSAKRIKRSERPMN